MPPGDSDWPRIKKLFEAAVDLPPDKRSRMLAAACGPDSNLRRQVEILLESDAQATGFIDTPVAVLPADLLDHRPDDANLIGRRLGAYQIVREIGRGGLAVVYLASRADEQFEKHVAIKLIRHGLDSEGILKRFSRERQILASLEHPNIARLIDAGTTEEGVSYFVMEYVEGLPMTRYCQEKNPSLNETLELFRQVCAAVSYAHQRLVIHRDLKPSNILITAEGMPKLLDFGIAKLLNAGDQPGFETIPEERLLTPAYASPEQINGGVITTTSDVYSLGVVLYELLTGQKPYKLERETPAELLHAIIEQDPESPSTVVARSDGNSKMLKGDIDNIALKAIRKEPERRYATVVQFSDDIRRHLEGLPVTARRDSFDYRAGKFVRRHRVAVISAVLVALAIVAGLIGTTLEARKARQARDRAEVQQARAERISDFLAGALSYSNPYAAADTSQNRRDATIKQLLDEVAPRLETELAGEPEAKASLERVIGEAYLAQTRVAEAETPLNNALKTDIALYGENSIETALSLSDLASLLVTKGDWTSAESYFQRSLQIFRAQRHLEPRHLGAFAALLTTYGDLLWTKGDYKAAEDVYGNVISLGSQLRPQDFHLITGAQIGLGQVRYAQGRLDEGAGLLREALSRLRQQPQRRLSLISAINPLAQVLTAQHNYEEALALVHEAEGIEREILGENNYFFCRSLYLDSYALCLKGDYPAAENTLNQLQALQTKNFPGDKITQANISDLRGMILTRTGRAPEGEDFAREATSLYKSFLTRGANGITLARMHWAESLTAQKKYGAAEQILREAYQDASEIQGPEHFRAKEAELQLRQVRELESALAHGK